MQIPVKIQLGINGNGVNSGTISINEETIGNTSSWAGSYHILSMDRHYHDYIFRPTQKFNEILDFPSFNSFSQLTWKSRSQQVIGNIGECIAAILARTCLNAKICDIAHLRTKGNIKTPDFIMNLEGQEINNLFSIFLEDLNFQFIRSKKWWAVESKATYDIKKNDQRKKALIQLYSFWSENRENISAHLGYGIIITFVYEHTAVKGEHREIWITLLLRKNANEFKEFLNSNPNNPKIEELNKQFFEKSEEVVDGDRC